MAGHSSWEEQRYLYPHDIRDKYPIWEREFNIEPFKYERARLPFRLTNEERLWRKQWLQDQVLAPNEPKFIPNLDKIHKNPVRYRWMVFWDGLFNRLRPVVGNTAASMLRQTVPKLLIIQLGIWSWLYMVFYHKQDWEKWGGWQVYGYKGKYLANVSPWKTLDSTDYADRGFKDRKTNRWEEHKY
ncbi:unnamed protein product [Rotaria sp. Silwood2]|nr:unnamed protein product [Rotaria sp. Silwood2]CAF2960258.1 unnamed protein product [Rotaria sp. Silwood2]CAF3215745.1 unnamed protein product [Rotaria sp. Silwood2]CAF3338548.1 unnamed protein product [Rotaria sp. Silwood2]CAF4179629.1 unnamed protein product [Rotaria sp. Silwood2]